MHTGYATPEGSARYAARFPSHQANSFFRDAQGLTVSSLGIGSYLGAMDSATDGSYALSVVSAVRNGINFIDTSLNYRNQHSEVAIGGAIEALFKTGQVQRDELVVCTKAGYLVPDAVPQGVLHSRDVVGNMHTINPDFLDDQLQRSQRNLGLETIDVFYLHNPETQLQFVPADIFYERVATAFERLEKMVAEGKIRFYGAATWDGFRKGEPNGLSLSRMVELAEQAGGSNHHFRFIQLPVNLGMVEAFTKLNEDRDGTKVNVLDVAQQLGVTAIASASLSQARYSRGLPDEFAQALPGTRTDAGRAIQFVRSVPGLTTALVGMSKPDHVTENLQVAEIPPLSPDEFRRKFGK
jgi:aryl-alcohol dehydrogenase-like predicted oxidoreductase